MSYLVLAPAPKPAAGLGALPTWQVGIAGLFAVGLVWILWDVSQKDKARKSSRDVRRSMALGAAYGRNPRKRIDPVMRELTSRKSLVGYVATAVDQRLTAKNQHELSRSELNLEASGVTSAWWREPSKIRGASISKHVGDDPMDRKWDRLMSDVAKELRRRGYRVTKG